MNDLEDRIEILEVFFREILESGFYLSKDGLELTPCK